MFSQDLASYNDRVADFRSTEYPMIKDALYLDHAGTTLPSATLLNTFSQILSTSLLGNPHSGSVPSQTTTSLIQNIRHRLLAFFNVDSSVYDLVFVANTTAAAKLVGEVFRTQDDGYEYGYHEACHTSLVGLREESQSSVCLKDNDVQEWILKSNNSRSRLLAYTAQSHITGRRYPLRWGSLCRKRRHDSIKKDRCYTLLDIASYAATSPVDLSNNEIAPDFVVLSLYKIFGFPDLGALLVHRDTISIFDSRKYFGGGTVDSVICHGESWHVLKSQFLHERLEDGTLPFHNILALDAALDCHQKLYGSMKMVSQHTTSLRDRLLSRLALLLHYNRQPVYILYSEPGSSGPVAFNLKDSSGAWVNLTEFEKLANIKKVYVRTGGLCGPGSIASLLDLRPWEIRKNFSTGYRCGGSDNDIISGKPTGVIRVSFGAMSTIEDVDHFIEFLDEFYCQHSAPILVPSAKVAIADIESPGFVVKELTVFPIKSCAGYRIPNGIDWEIKPEGLAWDREWCLIHRSTGQALNQKRHTRMTFLQPILDFEIGVLQVKYTGPDPRYKDHRVSVPLSMDPSYFGSCQDAQRCQTSRVCGDNVSMKIYTNETVNSFFSEILEVPCALARFPPSGTGSASRISKLRNGKPFESYPNKLGLPSPPDSDSEKSNPGKILLANESPILMINESSVRSISEKVVAGGGRSIPAASFRGNIVIGGSHGINTEPYSEEKWSSINIGSHMLKVLGSCQRCQMVCVDQQSGEKDTEPFLTLARERRVEGKVYFGVHMAYFGASGQGSGAKRPIPFVRVGDDVVVSMQSS